MSDLKMHPGELDINLKLVRRLVSDQAPQWSTLPLEHVASGGTDNVLYRLGGDMVVRLPRIDWAAGGVEKDFRWLPELAPSLPVEIPTPLFLGSPGDGYPWSWGIYRWLEGTPPTVGALADPVRLATDVARFLTALHGIDATEGPASGPQNFFRGVPLELRDDPTREAIAALQGRVDVRGTIEAWEVALSTPP